MSLIFSRRCHLRPEYAGVDHWLLENEEEEEKEEEEEEEGRGKEEERAAPVPF